MSKLSRRWRRLRQSINEWAGATYELDGCRFVLPPWADDVKRNILNGNYEGPERRLVAKWINGTRTVVELGGSFGIVSGIIGSRLQPAIRHIIVEANPILVDFCRQNAATARGKDAPVTVVGAAIAYGNPDGRVYFLPSDAFLGSRIADAMEPGVISVAAVDFRSVLADNGVDEYDLVCDIEGAELKLLRIDGQQLDKCAVAIIEMHSDVFADHGISEADFIAGLQARGFDIVDRADNVIVGRNRKLAAEN